MSLLDDVQSGYVDHQDGLSRNSTWDEKLQFRVDSFGLVIHDCLGFRALVFWPSKNGFRPNERIEFKTKMRTTEPGMSNLLPEEGVFLLAIQPETPKP